MLKTVRIREADEFRDISMLGFKGPKFALLFTRYQKNSLFRAKLRLHLAVTTLISWITQISLHRRNSTISRGMISRKVFSR